jgi:hypothetical protein
MYAALLLFLKKITKIFNNKAEKLKKKERRI